MPDFGRWTGNGGDPSLNEINRDDRFLDALASEPDRCTPTDPGEAELAFLLSDWRDGIRDTPATSGRHATRRRHRVARRPRLPANAPGPR